MPNPQRFEGLEEDKITWYSNEGREETGYSAGLEEDKIAGFSIRLSPRGVECIKSFGSRRNYRVLKRAVEYISTSGWFREG